MPLRWWIALLSVPVWLWPGPGLGPSAADFDASGKNYEYSLEDAFGQTADHAGEGVRLRNSEDPDGLASAAALSAEGGDIDEATRLYVEALAAYIVARRIEEPSVARVLLELAGLYRIAGIDRAAERASILADEFISWNVLQYGNLARVEALESELAEAEGIGDDAWAEAVREELRAEWDHSSADLRVTDPVPFADIIIGAGELILDQGLPEAALAVLEVGAEQLIGGSEGLLPSPLTCVTEGTISDDRLARLNASFAVYRRLATLADKILGLRNEHVADTRIMLALLHQERGNIEAARAAMRTALDIYSGLTPPRRAAVAMTRFRLGCLDYLWGDADEAAAQFAAALELSEGAIAPDHSDRLAILVWSGKAEAMMGNWDTALQRFEAAADTLRNAAVPSADSAQALAVINETLYMVDRPEKRIAFAALNLDLLERRLGADHPDLVEPLAALASAYIEAGRESDAAALYERLLRLMEAAPMPPGERWLHAERLSQLADLYRDTGDSAREAATVERLLAIKTDIYGDDDASFERGGEMIRLAGLYDRLERPEDARLFYRQGIAMLEDLGADDQPLLAEAYLGLGRHHLRLENLPAAAELFDTVVERWDGWPEFESTVASSRAGLEEITKRNEEREARLLIARSRRHNALLQKMEELESDYLSAPDDFSILGALVETYSSLLAYEQATDFGSNLFLLASRRLERLAALADPGDSGAARLVARVKANLYMTMRAYPEAGRWLAEAGDHGEAIVMRRMLEMLRQDRFEPVEEYGLDPFTVSVVNTAASPPRPGLLWPVLHFIVKPYAGAPAHRTIAFALVRQGADGAARYYLYVHSLNRARLIALYGTDKPAYEAVKARVNASLGAAVERLTARGEP